MGRLSNQQMRARAEHLEAVAAKPAIGNRSSGTTKENQDKRVSLPDSQARESGPLVRAAFLQPSESEGEVQACHPVPDWWEAPEGNKSTEQAKAIIRENLLRSQQRLLGRGWRRVSGREL